MAKILVIEDEVKIARVLRLELEHEGYVVVIEHDGKRGFDLSHEIDWDLMLLDVMLPGMTGLEFLRRLRSTGNVRPIILLTARDAVPDKVSGLDYGANDYITKPFAIEELLARIRSLLRYSIQLESMDKEKDLTQFLDLTIDLKLRSVKRGEQEIELTPREYELLLYLVKNRNQVVTREQILADVWGYEFMADTNVVDVYIRYLRQKIDKEYPKKLIHTVRGIGYALKE
ncbi:MAG TPA: response regulator transcription factor [Bacillota bacterium]|nr:response regulator transcription factor [Bacillota bacterium]